LYLLGEEGISAPLNTLVFDQINKKLIIEQWDEIWNTIETVPKTEQSARRVSTGYASTWENRSPSGFFHRYRCRVDGKCPEMWLLPDSHTNRAITFSGSLVKFWIQSEEYKSAYDEYKERSAYE